MRNQIAFNGLRVCLFIFSFCLSAGVEAQQWANGDANGDSLINSADVFYLANYLKESGAQPRGNCDLNYDGVIDEKDLNQLSSLILAGTEITEKSVGSTGGTLEKGAFYLRIPAGVFEQTANISVREGPNPYTSLTTSNLFTISGLPYGIDGNIDLRIPMLKEGQSSISALRYQTQGATGDDTNIAVVAPGNHFPDGAVRVMGWLIDAKNWVSSKGQAAAATISSAVTSAETAVGRTLEVYSLVYDKEISTYHNNFSLLMTELQYDDNKFYAPAKEIGYALEEFRTVLASDNNMTWSSVAPKTRVLFEDLGNDLGQSVVSQWAQYSDYIIFNKNKVPAGVNTELKAVIGHELFHLLQAQYDPRWYAVRRNIQDNLLATNAYLWWHEATAVYMEHRYSNVAAPETPDVGWENWLAPYEGMVIDSGSQTVIQRHGYGMSAMVKFLSDTYGQNIIGTIYDRMRSHWLFNNGEYPYESIANAANPSRPDINTWWRAFIKKNTLGEIYPEVPTLMADYLYSKPEKMIVPALTQTQYPLQPAKLFKAQDLSATPFLIKLDGLAFSAGQALTMAVPQSKAFSWWYRGDTGLMLFKLRADKKIEYLAGDGEQAMLSVSNLAALVAEGSNLILLVLNNRHKAPYTEKSDIVLYVTTGSPSSYTHNCPHVSAQFNWSGFKNIFTYNLLEGNNMNMRADYPDVGAAVGASVSVTPLNCKSGETYRWNMRLFGNSMPAYRTATCGVADSVSFDAVYNGTLSEAGLPLEYLSFTYYVENESDVTQGYSDCQLFVSPFLVDTAQP